MELAKLTTVMFARGQTILIRQILVSRQAVEKGEAVSDLDEDLVVADAPELVVDRLVRALLHIAVLFSLCSETKAINQRFASGIFAFSCFKAVAFSGSVLVMTAGAAAPSTCDSTWTWTWEAW